MSSELCKKPVEPPKGPGSPKGPTSPPPVPGPINNTISGQSLRSKHLKIVSEALYVDPGLPTLTPPPPVQGPAQGSVAGTAVPAGGVVGSAVLGGNQTPIGDADPIRAALLNYYGHALRPVKRNYFNNRTFQPSINPDEIYFDVRPQDEQKAENLYKSVLSSLAEYTYINFTLDVPFDAVEVQNNTIQSGRPNTNDPGFVGSDPRISTYLFEPRYNLFIKDYEDKANNKDTMEKALPHGHVFDFLMESIFDTDLQSYDALYLTYLSYEPDVRKQRYLYSDLLKSKWNFINYLENYITRPGISMKKLDVPGAQIDKFTNLAVVQDDAKEYFDTSGKLRTTANYGFYLEIPYEPPKMQQGEEDIFKPIFKVTNTDLNLYNVVIKTSLATDALRFKFEDVSSVTPTPTGQPQGSVAGTAVPAGGVLGGLVLGGKQTPTNASPLLDDKALQQAFGIKGTLTKSQIRSLRDLLPKELDYYTNLSYIEATKNNPVNNFTTQPTKYRTWDMTSFFEEYAKLFDSFKGTFKDAFNLGKDKTCLLLGESNEKIQKYRNNPVYDAFQKLMNKAAASAFKTSVDLNKIKNLAALFDQLEETPYEVLFYKVEKRSATNELLQTYYIANPDETKAKPPTTPKALGASGKSNPSPGAKNHTAGLKEKLVKFFDSQVKYGELYTYEVFAYTLVLAKKYHYEKVDKTFKSSNKMEYYVIFEFLKYYLQNIQKVKNSITATSNQMPALLSQFKKASEKLVDDYVASLATTRGQTYQNFVIGVALKIKQMFSTVHDIVRNQVATVNSQDIIPNRRKPVISSHFKKFFMGAMGMLVVGSKVPSTWDFSSEDFDQRYSKEIKDAIIKQLTPPSSAAPTGTYQSILNAAAQKYTKLLNSWDLLARIFDDLLVRSQVASKATLSDLNSRFIDLSKLLASTTVNIAPTSDLDAFKIVTSDYVPLMEIPLFTDFGRVLDGPPVAPKVSFVPYKDVNNKIMIKLKSENTEYREVPQIINDRERDLVDALIKSRGVDKQGRLLFKTDDYLTRFEIFRTDERPRSYTDFSGKLIKLVDLANTFSSFEYLDNIVPNKTYYYTFRSIDDHGNFSNPTPVYEFILNDDGGFLFPEVRIIDFEDTDYFQFESSMQKYIQIRPSAQNIIFDPELVNDEVKSARDLKFTQSKDSDPPLGIADDPVWGKNFKLRVTSKTSGKKVDINFTFTKKRKIVEEPQPKGKPNPNKPILPRVKMVH